MKWKYFIPIYGFTLMCKDKKYEPEDEKLAYRVIAYQAFVCAATLLLTLLSIVFFF